MKIIAKRPFISSKAGIGNVRAGRILDTDDGYAKMLIEAGLAEEYSATPPLSHPKAPEKPSFISPVGANSGSGPSSQAAQASPKQTAGKSKPGAKKIKGAR